LALFGAVFGLASVVRPAAGRACSSTNLTWRWIFYINVPIGIHRAGAVVASQVPGHLARVQSLSSTTPARPSWALAATPRSSC